MRVVSVAATALVLIGLLGSAQAAANTSQEPPAIAPCSEAIYTSRANAPPRPVRAIRLGPAVFNSLAGLTSLRGIDKPTKSKPFYSAKSPLTILAQAGDAVTVTIVRGQKNAALVYNRRWLFRLSNWHYQFAQVPRNVRMQLCRDNETKQALNTQYAGGFLFRKRGCVTIQVQAVGDSRTYRTKVRLGVARC